MKFKTACLEAAPAAHKVQDGLLRGGARKAFMDNNFRTACIEAAPAARIEVQDGLH